MWSHRHDAFECFYTEPHLLNIDLNVLLQVVAVQVEDQVVDKVKAVADDDEWQLVGEFGFLSLHTVEGKRLARYPNHTSTKPDARVIVFFKIKYT